MRLLIFSIVSFDSDDGLGEFGINECHDGHL